MTRRTVVSSGYSVVDISTSSGVAAPGGTASNVAEVLGALGWAASLVGKLGNDPAGRYAKSAVRANGVDTTNLDLDSRWATPVLLHEVNDGQPRWRFRCPHCGSSFAKHRPPPPSEADPLVLAKDAPDVFFFDRATLYSLRLAELWASTGTLIYFEPSGLGRPQLFDRAVALADVVKFSSERSAGFVDRLSHADSVVIETRGSDGVGYRTPSDGWRHQPAVSGKSIVDSAGAGDWLTAGLLQGLGATDQIRDSLRSSTALAEALRVGQRLGALACSWVGARPPAWTLPRSPRKIDYRFYCPHTVAMR